MPKALFRLILSVYVFLYRRTGGRIGGTMRGLPVLLLTTTGRKTGRQWTTPLGYFEHAGGYVVTGSYVAFGGAYPDAGNFDTPVLEPAPTMHIWRDSQHPSRVDLPIVPAAR